MRVAVLGMSAKGSSLELREVFAKAALSLFEKEFNDALLLSTCHRTEIYFSGDEEQREQIVTRLEAEGGLLFRESLYTHFSGRCFAHLAFVVSGLDSLIVGEAEIYKQAKRAYENALLYRQLPSPLHFLFQKSFKIAKEIRSLPIFPRGQRNLESTIFQLYRNQGQGSVLFIGNSAINRKILSYFKKKGVEQITLCTRAPHSATELADVTVIDWSKLNGWQEFPFVICGTNQTDYLLTPDQISSVQTKMIIDLGVPRNVDPRLGEWTALLNIEELSRHLQVSEGKHVEEVDECRERARFLAARQLVLFEQKEEKLCLIS